VLLDNAILYSPGGGDVDVSVAVREGYGVVSVRDYGIGIPKERQARIFERFYRAHAGTPYDVGGLGIRLYLSRQLVTRLGGQMWFESVEGEGSTFNFSLRLAG
jgi:signal transduction histidine kinase